MKMKKFINAPETITDDELVGLGMAYPDILTVDGHLVISKDLETADRVTIVTYGGSGHEPAQAGFVGKGMLDVQAVGDIFAAPNAKLVFDAMKLADKGHGVLLLTLNYAGDQLAGKQAIKLAQKAGLNFRQVVTGEEIQFDPNGEDNKRGLAGAVGPVPCGGGRCPGGQEPGRGGRDRPALCGQHGLHHGQIHRRHPSPERHVLRRPGTPLPRRASSTGRSLKNTIPARRP